MNNHQASSLRPGRMIRRKESFERESATTRHEILIVERIEPKADLRGEVTIHAGEQAFNPWEIERVWHRDTPAMP